MILIIDADGLCFKAYYALENKVDYPMCVGVPRSIIKLYNDFNPTSIALVFDSEDKELSKIYPDYRKDREEPWDLGKEDYEYLLSILVLIGLPVYKDDREADRIIASIVNLNKNKDIIIYSDDKDFFQLLSSNIKQFSETRGNIYITPKDVEKQFKIPNNTLFREYLIFNGDNVDRIPRILSQEETLQVIKTKGKLEDWFFKKDFKDLPKQIQSKLNNKYEQVEINYKLVNLLDDKEKPKLFKSKIKNLDYIIKRTYIREEDMEKLKSIANKLKPIFKESQIIEKYLEKFNALNLDKQSARIFQIEVLYRNGRRRNFGTVKMLPGMRWEK